MNSHQKLAQDLKEERLLDVLEAKRQSESFIDTGKQTGLLFECIGIPYTMLTALNLSSHIFLVPFAGKQS